jgi:hypothetical protein
VKSESTNGAYSCRREAIGSTRVARRAGRAQARKAPIGVSTVRGFGEFTQGIFVPFGRSEEAGSGDLAVTIGALDSATAAKTQGSWVRVWKRDLGGRWRIVFQTETQ